MTTSSKHRILTFAVPSAELLDRLASRPLDLGEKPRNSGVRRPPVRHFHREVYLDTADDALAARGVLVRVRTEADGRQELAVELGAAGSPAPESGRRVLRVRIRDGDAATLLAGVSAPARAVRALVDPLRLVPRLELHVDRRIRRLRRHWWSTGAIEVAYETVHARAGRLTAALRQLTLRGLTRERALLEALAGALQHEHPLEPVHAGLLPRLHALLAAAEVDALRGEIRGAREVAVVLYQNGRIALQSESGSLTLPVGPGTGEEACRAVLRQMVGTAQAQIRLLGRAPIGAGRPPLEVWLAHCFPAGSLDGGEGVVWRPVDELLALAGAGGLADARTLAALAVAGRSELGTAEPLYCFPREPGRSRVDSTSLEIAADSALPLSRNGGGSGHAGRARGEAGARRPRRLLDANLSQLAFNARVLALAADPSVPLLERLKFLGIFSSNQDELFMLHMAKSRARLARQGEPSSGGLRFAARANALEIRARELAARAYRLLHGTLLPELAAHGLALLRWPQLTDAERQHLAHYYHDVVQPLLSVVAVSPAQPFPHVPSRRLALAARLRERGGSAEHFAIITVPAALPALAPLPGGRRFVPIEEIICANIRDLWAGLELVDAYAFRVTRAADLNVDEDGATDLRAAVEDEVRKRPFGPVVRLEVEQAMPQPMQQLLLQEFRFERPGVVSTLSEGDVYRLDWPLDLARLRELAALPIPELRYPALVGNDPFAAAPSVLDALRQQDVLVRYPHDSFEATAERLLVEAAEDSAVLAIKLTVYRTGHRSRVLDALARASRSGKDVTVLMEVKARCDEERNLEWGRALEAAGVRVVYGRLGLKTHAKVALVVRREGAGVRRYGYIGTGNLNAATAAQYTDLGLFTADLAVGEDLSNLFHALTGLADHAAYRRLLVAPATLRPRMLERIEREAAHARTGRPARIRAKMNGLDDPEVIGALYRASQAGVDIELLVRGICTLRPGVPGLSDRIRVTSRLGRFLEHGRIFHFENGGRPEYYLGSADWRTRNLRQRIEVVVQVTDPAIQQRLDTVLTAELAEPGAWVLAPDGSYSRAPHSAAPAASAAPAVHATPAARATPALTLHPATRLTNHRLPEPAPSAA